MEAAPPVRNRAELQASWKRTIRKRPLAHRLAWLKSDEGIAAFGARQRWEKIHYILVRIHDLAAAVPSMSWLAAAENQGAEFPVPGMVLGEGLIRIGSDEIATRRFTPAIAVKVEDLLDRLDALEAARYHHPPSITGLQVEMIRWRKGREDGSSPRDLARRRRPAKDKSRKIEVSYGDYRVQQHPAAA
jgi:hypothetical protein